MGRSKTMLDFIEGRIMIEQNKLTKSEFKRIRNYGSEEELLKAIEIMEAAGGYENLADD